ncbi:MULTISPECIES: sulfatase-like hydrolase/transferase [unclassified Cellulophaga]|uniref:sulfatase-like hydrolase/transferase n=1 Tax=unclassified Cellulophaga TaxID=2634405 RepID=UPI0026E22320|nr:MULTISPECIES: sulfatase-like hydrolase/transferase [unclassified Cellulophaga]MDO6490205.1 sulfatase-like hydrolase/transferase [Cellulophaga sp. 2_MG-2023]MDO6494601.1 sulfatase-like hydrolase/transferase [Cellulophaga sp. 3_MG-2023]
MILLKNSKTIFFAASLLVLSCTNKPKKVAQITPKVDTNTKQPNILLVLCDDLGYSDVGFNGSTDIKTPELDKLASNGTMFTSAYVAHPFCGPSRAALLTGRYPHTIGSQFNLPANGESLGKGISTNEQFIAKTLQESGYYTGAIGKWHLGATQEFHPNQRGFTDFYGFLGGGHNYFPEEYRPKYEKQKKANKKIIRDYILPLEHNGKEVKETEYLTDAFSREASRFVKEASNKEKPFFLYLAYNAPHVPLEAKEEDLKIFLDIKDKDRKTYAAMVYAVDRGVGAIVNTLKETNQLENTLIIFLSDNGGNTDHGATNFPLHGRKGDTWEGGYRVPMFMYWPKHIAKGEKNNFPINSLDLYPTLAHLAKARIPNNKILDGKNAWESILTNKDLHKKETLFAMRHREGYTDVSARKDEWKALKVSKQPWKLFKITEDIGEENDLSTKHPDILNSLVSDAEKWSKTHTEPLWFDPTYLQEMWKDSTMATFNNTFLNPK